MKTKLFVKIILTGFLFYSQMNFCQTVKVPYFGKVTTQKLCGNTTKNCQPTSSMDYSPVAGKAYTGKVHHAIFRSFEKKKYFNSIACNGAVPNDNDVIYGPKHQVNAKVDQNERTNFNVKVNANLAELVKQRFANLSQDAKAKLLFELTKSVEKATKLEMQLVYQTIDLSPDFIDINLKTCKQKDNFVATGVSILSVTGEWGSNTIKDALINFEVSAEGIKIINGSMKAEYEKNKNEILDGNFEPISIIFAVAYR